MNDQIKQAYEAGVQHVLDSIVKVAQEGAIKKEEPDFKARRAMIVKLLATLIGGGYGASLGGAAKGPGGALMGGLAGAGLGFGAGALSNKMRDYAGMDPMATNVAQVK